MALILIFWSDLSVITTWITHIDLDSMAEIPFFSRPRDLHSDLWCLSFQEDFNTFFFVSFRNWCVCHLIKLVVDVELNTHCHSIIISHLHTNWLININIVIQNEFLSSNRMQTYLLKKKYKKVYHVYSRTLMLLLVICKAWTIPNEVKINMNDNHFAVCGKDLIKNVSHFDLQISFIRTVQFYNDCAMVTICPSIICIYTVHVQVYYIHTKLNLLSTAHLS